MFGWRTAYRGLVTDDYLYGRLSVARRVEAFRDAVASGAEETLVWDDGLVKAFVTLGPSRDQDAPGAFEVWGLYVGPGFQRRGLGARIVAHAEAIAASRGFSGVTLWTLGENVGSVAFYRSQGYTPDGARQLVDFLGADVVRLRKRLAP